VHDNAGAPLAAGFETLAEVLASQGLVSAAFVSSAVLAPGRGLEQGFETYSLGKQGCPGASRTRRAADEVVDESLEWLARQGSSPFFLWIHLYDTHAPIRVPLDFTLAHADPYLAAIAYEDSQIARLVDYLEERGLLDESLIVIAGDHGESLGDHGEESHGLFVYDEVLRVPLIVRGPGLAPARVSAAVRLVDVMPTVLDLFRMRSAPLDGVSLTTLMAGADEAPREVYAESRYPQRFGWATLRTLRAGRWKVIEAPRPELYDVAADPREQRNVFDSNRHVAAALINRLRSEYRPHDPASPSRVVDGAMADRLASLGYVAGAASQGAPGDAPADPKDMIDAFNHITSRQARQSRRCDTQPPD
jgi:hypothetical protein